VRSQAAVQAVGLVRWGSASSLDGAGVEGVAGSHSVRASHQEAALARRRRRWHCFVATGLIVMPFLPASNLFFWVCASFMISFASFADKNSLNIGASL